MTRVQGERIPGGSILITGLDGIRYTVRPQATGITYDADECRDETIVQLHGEATLSGCLARSTWFA